MQLFVPDKVRLGDGSQAGALLVDGGLVQAVGAAKDLRPQADHIEEIPGVMSPGLRDAHFHPVTYAASLIVPSLKNAVDFAEIGERLRSSAAGVTAGQPISAIRLDDEGLAEGRLPTRHDLDAMLGDRPVIVHRYCGHIAMANTAALRLAGVSAETPDPNGGTLDRDENGEPTGVLREMGIETVSLPLADTAGPAVTDDQVVDAMYALASV
ncbi:MAG: amidohydrolase family protein, partial [Acidimicrobiia bacterium]